MVKKNENNSFRSLIQILNSSYFQQRFSRSRTETFDILQKYNWNEIFYELEKEQKDLSCAKILEICRPTLQLITAEPEMGWLAYTAKYAVGLSYPDSCLEKCSPYNDGALFFLAVLQAFFRTAKRRGWLLPELDFQLPTEHEIEHAEYKDEYRAVIRKIRHCFVYEMMRLSQETSAYKTLAHIVGVHNLALKMARGMIAAGTKIDLTLLSAAAALHDIGKFGCKDGERVPYLHYYYTDKWCRDIEASNIAHIAANHSAWDLELENLSVESLLLIYADFRVKQYIDEEGQEQTELYSLKDSFDVIFAKLDDVDEQKQRRYAFVYAKLQDFEDYMRYLGVDIAETGEEQRITYPDIALMNPAQVLNSFKNLSLEHNISLMHRLGTERLFGNIIEAARSEKDWKNLRAYIDILNEYFTYLGTNQKLQTLSFLYELLVHQEGDIRRAAANLIGNIIAHFDDGYKKELPPEVIEDAEMNSRKIWQQYLQKTLFPDHKVTDQHKSWMGYSLKIMAASTLEQCPQDERHAYLQEIWRFFADYKTVDAWTSFVLLDMINYLPLDICNYEDLLSLCNFAINCYQKQSTIELNTAALRILRKVATGNLARSSHLAQDMIDFAKTLTTFDNPTAAFLIGELKNELGQDSSAEQAMLLRPEVVSDILLENLKTATPWIIKSVNIQLLLDRVEKGATNQLLHIATHFSNLLKVSERVVVRHDAGSALVKIAPLLAHDQRNEIATELLKSLEVDEYAFSKYIPIYLGEFALWLQPKELDEVVNRLEMLICSPSDTVGEVALDTIGILLECYAPYQERFGEEAAASKQRERIILGMLLKGLSSYRLAVREQALLVIGRAIFASDRMLQADKCRIFSLCYKKLLFLISENMEGKLAFFYRAALLNYIYRFIVVETLFSNNFDFINHNKIAFFPGTFDPFTLSHKGIVSEICNMGFELMLAIDEFSWSKNVQPRKIRRQIAVMSLADELNVHVFPDSIPINIANPADLKRLHQLFPEKELYIVVGSDVVRNASSYQAEPEEYSIHHANHIIFSRAKSADDPGALESRELERLDGDVICLSLPTNLEDISSTRIRENIDHNRDISNLIDKRVQEYIYKNSLYLREPQYKPLLKARDIRFVNVENPSRNLLASLLRNMPYSDADKALICESHCLYNDRLLLIYTGADEESLEGFIAFRHLAGEDILREVQDIELAEAVRRKATGKILRIGGIYTKYQTTQDAEQLLLTEALDLALRDGCTFALFHPVQQIRSMASVLAVLKRQGFINIDPKAGNNRIYLTDMRAPVALIQNLETAIKEPLASNEKVLAAIATAHEQLQLALSELYPGKLILSLSSGVIYHRLISKITSLNQVPVNVVEPRQLGPYMCVPFGKILRGRVVPNTVTKTLHTDKVYPPDLADWQIEAYPFYASLEDQLRTIKSFRRPVILVDDMLDNADRLSILNPMFEEQGIEVVKVLVGLMSGKGRDLVQLMDRDADSIYYIPNMRDWFVESNLYPFIGGDTVRRESRKVANLLPSINMILPYASPLLDKSSSKEAVFNFSLTCLNNSKEILLALESEYLLTFGRNLTLNRLAEAIMLPQCPDKGECINYDAALTASVYLDNEIEMLLRTRSTIL